MRVFLQNTLLVLASLVLAGAVIESALRVLPNKYRMQWDHFTNNKTDVTYRQAGGGLYRLYPDREASIHRPCLLTGPNRINAQGARGIPWQKEKKGFRVVAIGDSFVEAIQIPDGEEVSSKLEEALGIEVLNAGISGYSTVTELEAYRRFIRPYKPDIVVLFMYLGNDIKGNSCVLDPQRSLCARVVDGEISYKDQAGEGREISLIDNGAAEQAIEKSKRAGTFNLKNFFRRNFVLYGVLHDLKMIMLSVVNRTTEHVPVRWRIYLNEVQPAWRDAWAITADVLATLKVETKADNARLAVVAIPEHFSYSTDWKRALSFGAGVAAPAGFDPAGPARRLAEITASLGIPTLDILPELLSYRDRFGLPDPFFSFSCDGHWNPLAHYLVAHEVAAFLDENGLLPEDVPGKGMMTEKRNGAFARKPRDILGDEVYRQIFNGGFYTGKQDGR